jgi:hypothetical protein
MEAKYKYSEYPIKTKPIQIVPNNLRKTLPKGKNKFLNSING